MRLEDLCTVSELRDLSMRWQVVMQLLHSGQKYEDIESLTGRIRNDQSRQTRVALRRTVTKRCWSEAEGKDT